MQVLELFVTVRLGQDKEGTSEPRDIDIANRRFPNLEEDEGEAEDDYIPIKRYQYSREHKLATIDYF
jgi:hypothetical protein